MLVLPIVGFFVVFLRMLPLITRLFNLIDFRDKNIGKNITPLIWDTLWCKKYEQLKEGEQR